MNLFNDLPEDVCRRNAPLAPLTWFKLGGPAEFLISPRNETELSTILRRCRDAELPVRYLGLGANLIVADEGVSGVVVRLDAPTFSSMAFEGHRVTVGAGVDLTKLVLKTVRMGLAGLENLAGIPGTIGGGISMNCGGKYGEIGPIVRQVNVIGADGQERDRDQMSLNFSYRHTALGDDCVVRAVLELEPTDPVALEQRFREIWTYKQSTQPPLGAESVGCIFRNPTGASAGKIIDDAGLKGLRNGSAYVSDKHANFILADAGGRASDVIAMIRLIQQRVFESVGLHLEPEVKIWTDDAEGIERPGNASSTTTGHNAAASSKARVVAIK